MTGAGQERQPPQSGIAPIFLQVVAPVSPSSGVASIFSRVGHPNLAARSPVPGFSASPVLAQPKKENDSHHWEPLECWWDGHYKTNS